MQNNKNLTKMFCFVEIQLQWIASCQKSSVHNLDFNKACLLIEVYFVKRQEIASVILKHPRFVFTIVSA